LPYKECIKTFSTRNHAKRHHERAHAGKRYSCLSTDCPKIYTDTQAAKNHYRREHLCIHERRSCPKKECTKAFFSHSDALRHYRTAHDGKRFPCPTAEITVCKSTFASKQSAQEHYAAVYLSARVSCPFLEPTGCTATLSQIPAVRNHVKRLHTPRWMCSIPTCRNNVSKQGVSNGQIARHMAKHDELGHLVGLDAPSPIQLSSLPAEITDSQTKLKYWLSTDGIPFYILHIGLKKLKDFFDVFKLLPFIFYKNIILSSY